MEEATNQSPEAMEALVSRIFTNISSLKSAYIQLQAAHTPYDPDIIQAADKLSLLKTYEVMLKKFQSEIQNKDSETVQLEQQIQDSSQKRGHPRAALYQGFLKLAKVIWLLHRLVHSFDPPVKNFEVKRGNEFSEVYMENVVKDFVVEDGDEKPKVDLMVMPGFWIGGSIIQSQVYLTGIKVAE
ncbi:hypothetical protein SASPL_133124 [Salvia splendens]|uniref:DUF641 domain-containing protein n=1 Tax=Salvia splendens TaxID=180675 RepID=A0A8X8X3Q1_SALSN|nr:hypothetical protein SASPL_133124 [Salvia splendens]